MARYRPRGKQQRRTTFGQNRPYASPFTGMGSPSPPPTPSPAPAPAPTPAPAPNLAAGPAPAPAPAPTDAAYQGTLATNEAERQRIHGKFGNPAAGPGASFLERYGQSGQNLAQQYGFEGFSDPYSLAKQLERSFQQQRVGTSNSLAAQGQLYSGHMDTELGHVDQRYQQGYHDLEQRYQQGLSGISETAANALFALDQGDADAFERLIGRLGETEPEPIAAAQPAQPAWLTERKPEIDQKWLDYARAQYRAGHRTGPQWRTIIDQLGYDPRGEWK